MKRRIPALLLCLCMVVSLTPTAFPTLAEGENIALNAAVLGVSQNSPEGETADKLFDGNCQGTKWCVGGNTGWVVFDIKAPLKIGKIKAYHAGQSSNSWDVNNAGNTKAYALQTFNGTGVPAESDFSDDSKWTTIGEETNNTESIKETTVTMTAPARYFRLNVTDSGDPNTSKAIRFYELELFGEAVIPSEEKAIAPGTISISNPTKQNDGNGDYYIPGSYIWFWKNNGTEPIKWRVLNAEQTNDGAAGIFLLSEELLSNSVYFDNTDPMRNAWQGSDAQSWCKDFAGESGTAVADALGSEERAALHSVTKTDAAKTLFELNWAEGHLENDMMFFLSAEELYDYVGTYDDAPGMRNTENWWLRSPHENSESGSAGAVEEWVSARAINTERGARPACNLNSASVLFASAAERGKPEGIGLSAIQPYTGNEWKLTLKDDNRSFAVTETELNGDAGGSVTFNYTGAKTGENEYISAILADSTDNMLYYGRLAQAVESGSVTFTLPAGLADGSYTLKVFNEQCNGDKRSDYASAFQDVALTAPAQPTTPDYTVTWKNYDGEALETDYDVPYGTIPEYNGETPEKPDDRYYIYSFAGWDPEPVPVKADAEYTAQFTPIEKDAAFVGNNLRVYQDIKIGFCVKLTEAARNAANAEMVFTVGSEPARTIRVPFSEAEAVTFNGMECYLFFCPMNAKEMADEVTAQFVADGINSADTKTCSIRIYAQKVFAHPELYPADGNLAMLMKSMLNYGAAAQALFDYKTDDPANSILESDDKTVPEVNFENLGYGAEVTGSLPEGVTCEASLVLEDLVKVHFIINGSTEGLIFKLDGREVAPVTENGVTYVETEGLYTVQLDKKFNFTISSAAGTWSVDYGAFDYGAAVQQTGTDTNLIKVMQAMYGYFLKANAYWQEINAPAGN